MGRPRRRGSPSRRVAWRPAPRILRTISSAGDRCARTVCGPSRVESGSKADRKWCGRSPKGAPQRAEWEPRRLVTNSYRFLMRGSCGWRTLDGVAEIDGLMPGRCGVWVDGVVRECDLCLAIPIEKRMHRRTGVGPVGVRCGAVGRPPTCGMQSKRCRPPEHPRQQPDGGSRRRWAMRTRSVPAVPSFGDAYGGGKRREC